VRFLGDPKIPLDTNGVERALRGVAVGRSGGPGQLPTRGSLRSGRAALPHPAPRIMGGLPRDGMRSEPKSRTAVGTAQATA
jgi:hypothetical protein